MSAKRIMPEFSAETKSDQAAFDHSVPLRIPSRPGDYEESPPPADVDRGLHRSSRVEPSGVSRGGDVYPPPRIAERAFFSVAFHTDSLDEIDEISSLIIIHLRRISNDFSIALLYIRLGSVVIVLDSTRDGYEVIYHLFTTGQLTSILGKPIKTILLEQDLVQGDSLTPTTHSMRKFLEKSFPRCENLDVLCLDHFKEKVFRQFSSGMDYISRINLLLDIESSAAILKIIREYYPDLLDRYKDILVYQLMSSRQLHPAKILPP